MARRKLRQLSLTAATLMLCSAALVGCGGGQQDAGAKGEGVFSDRFEYPVVWEDPIQPDRESQTGVRVQLEADGGAQLRNVPMGLEREPEGGCIPNDVLFTGDAEWKSIDDGVIEIVSDDLSAEVHASIDRFDAIDWMDPSWLVCGASEFGLALRSELRRTP